MSHSDALSVLLALGGAFGFGLSHIFARFGLQHADARLGSLVSIASTTAFYVLLLPFYAAEVPWDGQRLAHFALVFAAIGLFSPSISLFLSMEGTHRLGPTISGTFAGTAPLFAVASAALVLGERITPTAGLGTLAIVAGGMVLSWQGAASRGWPLWAVLFPLGAALCRGGIQMSTKFGFAVAPAPFTGALITFATSFLAVGLTYRLGGTPLPAGLVRETLFGRLRWFAVTGVLNGLALMALYAALNLGRVVVVSPVISTYPLFTFACSLLLRLERLGPRIFAGVVLVISGVIAVSTQ